ncbi:siderophore-interacting protein [Spirabiliibacterium falconis]|uniref:siderophore-interacting protein n=1 Tax=Spirabiliibacterium falconis TaxID=572023 RepID=UPI001AAD91AB|nr:siderophore-interacting protein [Spirabiliibacterium falconis]MBE2894561.1 SIP domain-containing protein [Spirabiliibacterium falconis]
MTRTPIADHDLKLDIIEHVNDDHRKELLAIAQVYLNPNITDATLLDLYHEGMLLQTQTETHHLQSQFVPFLTDKDLHTNVRHLAMHAVQQRTTPQSHYFFHLLDKTQPTPNISRLILKTCATAPENSPGYAWRFTLKSFANQPYAHIIPHVQNQPGRYYTLRKIVNKTNSDCILYVDVFCHGDTLGSLWAKSLKCGDILHANATFYEHTDHLTGQSVLIGDETALPTIANLIECWHHPISPIIISITQDPKEQHYLDEVALPPNTHIIKLEHADSALKSLAVLDKITTIDSVWGACEQHDAKTIRHYLRNQRKLTSTQQRMKAYWIKT